jgi:two-component system, LytTR family, sensor kinase
VSISTPGGFLVDSRPAYRQPLWWAVAVVWWTLSGFAGSAFYRSMELSAGGNVEWDHVLLTGMASAYLWVPLTVLVIWMVERYPLEPGRLAAHVAVHAAGAIFVCVFRGMAVVVLNGWVGWYAEVPPIDHVLTKSFANNFFLHWMLVGVAHALLYARRARLRETQLAEARLQMLKAQVHPHFLFNTLNAISSHVHHDPETAERMIARLSELLRTSLESARTYEATLAEEIEALLPYVELESIRFEDRLRFRWSVGAEAHTAMVPHLLLQPLVENAVRHGIAPLATGGTVEIGARRSGAWVELWVRDDGVGIPTERTGGSGLGVGLANVRARLHQHYGDRQTFDVRPLQGGGTEARLRVPFRPSGRPVGTIPVASDATG